jgi:hypothetical protein
MSRAARRTATYADIEALPDNVIGEIIDGELVASPRPGPAHGVAAIAIGGDVNGSFGGGGSDDRGPGGWWILGEPELHLEGHVLVPDLAG